MIADVTPFLAEQQRAFDLWVTEVNRRTWLACYYKNQPLEWIELSHFTPEAVDVQHV